MIAPDALTQLLREVAEFLTDEADNRAHAGSIMSDYEREPRDLADRVEAALAELDREAA